jgi:hypothetical protein
MTKRWVEFFEGENNRLSMMRLTVFGSFFPASYVVVATKNETIFGWFVSVYVLGYVGGKGADVIGRAKNAKPSIK